MKDKCYGKIISGQRFDIGSNADYLTLQNILFNQKNKI
jgi:UTP--glucose-1-phosphate uridylyltransferase